MLGPLVILHTFERIEDVYFEAQTKLNKLNLNNNTRLRFHALENIVSITTGDNDSHDTLPLILVMLEIVTKSLSMVKIIMNKPLNYMHG